jgi:hypothetical protein
MATWTNDVQEIKHLSEISDQVSAAMFKPGPSTFELLNGTQISGRIAGMTLGNNAGQGGKWLYYGEVRVSPQGGGYDITLDYTALNRVF